MKKELREFTSEELLGEIRRRLANPEVEPKKAEYASVVGVVKKHNSQPLCRRYYQVTYTHKGAKKEGTFRMLGGVFRLGTAPDVGDKVVLRTRLTKSCREFDPCNAVIASVIQEGGSYGVQ